MSPGAPIPPAVWETVRGILGELHTQRRSCCVVLLINVKKGEPADGDVLFTSDRPGSGEAGGERWTR